MADHFYSLTGDQGLDARLENITVGTVTAGATTVELRVPDGQSLTRKQVAMICENLSSYFEVGGTLANPVPILT